MIDEYDQSGSSTFWMQTFDGSYASEYVQFGVAAVYVYGDLNLPPFDLKNWIMV